MLVFMCVCVWLTILRYEHGYWLALDPSISLYSAGGHPDGVVSSPNQPSQSFWEGWIGRDR